MSLDESHNPRVLPLLRDSELPAVSREPVTHRTRRGQRIALTVLFLVVSLAVAWIAAPLWVGLVLGTVMAFTGQPVYRRLVVRLRNRRPLASIVTTLLGGVLTAAGGAVVAYVLTGELIAIIALLQSKLARGLSADVIGVRGARFLDSLRISQDTIMAYLQAELGRLSNYAAQAAGLLVHTTTSALLTLVIALWTMYYVLLEWPRMAVRLERVLPLDPLHTRALILEFREVGRTAFIATVASALVQGGLAGIGYAMTGIRHPVTWGMLTAVVSFIPVIGTALVWVPVGVYLLAVGDVGWAIFVFAWGPLVVMAMTDYVVRPRLVGAKRQAHPLLMLVALIGGIEVLGLAGLIVGPVLMSLFLAIARIYERDVLCEQMAEAKNEQPE